MSGMLQKKRMMSLYSLQTYTCICKICQQKTLESAHFNPEYLKKDLKKRVAQNAFDVIVWQADVH